MVKSVANLMVDNVDNESIAVRTNSPLQNLYCFVSIFSFELCRKENSAQLHSFLHIFLSKNYEFDEFVSSYSFAYTSWAHKLLGIMFPVGHIGIYNKHKFRAISNISQKKNQLAIRKVGLRYCSVVLVVIHFWCILLLFAIFLSPFILVVCFSVRPNIHF